MPFQKGNKINLGRKLTDYQKSVVSLTHKGKPKSAEHKLKLSIVKKGMKAPWVSKANKRRTGENHPMCGKILEWMVGENNHQWKGNNVGYIALHSWVRRCLGKARVCSYCGSFGGIHGCGWANISGEYKRIVSDWQSLCPKCNKNDGVKIPLRFYNQERRRFL